MNLLLWVVQIILGIHTAIGAVWKFSNSTQAVPSLSAIPHWAWLVLSAMELICAFVLIASVFKKSLGKAVPLAAVFVLAEMLLFIAMHLVSGEPDKSPVMYWLVTAAVATFVAYGRFSLKPVVHAR